MIRLFGKVLVGIGHPLTTLVTTLILINFLITALAGLRSLQIESKSFITWTCSLYRLQSTSLLAGMLLTMWELDDPTYRNGVFTGQPESLAILWLVQLNGLLCLGVLAWLLSPQQSTVQSPVFFEDLKGIAHHSPISAAVIAIATGSQLSLPFTMGFWSRWYFNLASANLHWKSESAIFTSQPAIRLCLLIATLAIVVCLIGYVRVIREMFWEQPLSKPNFFKGVLPYTISITVAAGLLVTGAIPQLLTPALQGFGPPRPIPIHKTSGSAEPIVRMDSFQYFESLAGKSEGQPASE